MGYVSGACSFIKPNGVMCLSEHGAAFIPGKQNVLTSDGFVKSNIHILGYGMECFDHRLKILDGPRAGKEVTLRCTPMLNFVSTEGPLHPATSNRTFVGLYYDERGMPIRTKVLIRRIAVSKNIHRYCYALDEGTYWIGAGTDPLFVGVHFPRSEHNDLCFQSDSGA